MRLMIKFLWAFLAPYLLMQIFGEMGDDGSTNLRLVFKIMKSNNSLSVTQSTVSSDAVTTSTPTVDQINTELRKKLEALQKRIATTKITMESEIATISSKMENIEKKVGKLTNIETSLNYKIPDLKTLIATIAIHQEKIEHDLTSSMAMLKKLEAKEKLLPGGDHHSRIAFLAQRNSDFSAVGKIISYETNELNFGEGFHKTTGLFRAPLKGIYHFYFSALKMKRETSGTSRLTVQLRKIGDPEVMLAQSHINSFNWYDWFPVTFQATIKLDEGNIVGVKLIEGQMYQINDKRHPWTTFGGFLVTPAK